MLLVAALVGLLFLPSPWGFVAVALAAVIEVGEVAFWIRFLRRYRISTGAEGLVGERGEATEPCMPTGRVKVRGELWNARSRSPVAAGDAVRVVAVDGLSLDVEPDASLR